MRRLSFDEVKHVEKDILKDVDAFVERHGLEYYLAYGTLLGAVRHRGFIPWDDDVDIYMPRESYEIFLKEFNKKSERYKAISFSNTENYPYAFAKVIDTHTELDEFRFQRYKSGVYIDIFPLDYVGDSVESAMEMNQRLKNRREAVKYKTLRTSYYRGFKKYAVYTLQLGLSLVNTEKQLKEMDRISRLFQNQPTKYCASMGLFAYGAKEVLETAWFRDYIKMQFEDTEFRVPIEYKKVLENVYGDYMKMPPEEKRITHHSFDAWIKET